MKTQPWKRFSHLIISLMIMSLCLPGLVSCQARPPFAGAQGLKVVATTSIVGDVVSHVGGDKIALELLLPLGTDPHSFSPTPRDASKIADADIIFANGVGLEEFLKPLMHNIGGSAKVIEVSKGITLLKMIDEETGTNQLTDDPHTWMDPTNIMVWVDNIEKELSADDPTNAETYQNNAQIYRQELTDLDQWIRNEVSKIPPENRKIVTEHLIFGYFAHRYGFDQVGAIIPGFSSLAEPSARDIVQIEDAINTMKVRAIFTSIGVNSNLAQRIAVDTGTKLVSLYMESLSDKSGEAGTYIDFMHFDVNSIVNALK